MKKMIAIRCLFLVVFALPGCAHAPAPAPTVTVEVAAPPPPVMAPSVAAVASPVAGQETGWVAAEGDARQHWLACRSTRRLCRMLMPKEVGESPDDTVFKHTLCQLYLRFECPSAEEEDNRG